MRAARGQAMVESAVALAALSTLLIAIPVFTAWHDLQRAALRGARDGSYMAGWSGLDDTASLTRRASEAVGDAPWAHPADGARLVGGLHDGDVLHQEGPPPGRAAALMDFISRPLGDSGDDALVQPLTLGRLGYHVLQVSLDVPALRGTPAPFDELPLRLTERAAVLTETWNAGSPDMVRGRVEPIVPSSALRSLLAPMTPLAAPLRLIEPSFARLCIGLIEPDRVPEIRLGAAAVARRLMDTGDERC